MIAGLDSSTQPSPAQAVAAKNAGVRLWSGYLQTKPNVGLYAPWSQQGFENARLCGSTPIAYCSGWDNPATCQALAAAWKVRLCLDVENGIRPNGAWVQGWLDASGAGLYGNLPVHTHKATFHILAAYPGFDPQATWDPRLLAPPGPSGWQWQGTHTEFGVGVDRGWFDDWFASTYGSQPGDLTGEDMTPAQEADFTALIWRMAALLGLNPADPQVAKYAIPGQVSTPQLLAAINKLATPAPAVVDQAALTAAVTAAMAPLKVELDAIKAKLDKDLA